MRSGLKEHASCDGRIKRSSGTNINDVIILPIRVSPEQAYITEEMIRNRVRVLRKSLYKEHS